MDDYGERLARIELSLIMLQAQVTAMQATLVGDGRSGLGVAVDRLEQSYERIKWNYRIALTALIGLILKTVWELLTKPSAPPVGWPYMGFF